MGISHPTINTRDVAAFVPFRRGLGCGSTIPPLHVLVHRLMGRSMGLGYEHPVRPYNRSYLSIARIEYSWKMHAPRWLLMSSLLRSLSASSPKIEPTPSILTTITKNGVNGSIILPPERSKDNAIELMPKRLGIRQDV